MSWRPYTDNYGRSWYYDTGAYLLWAYVGVDPEDRKELVILEALSAAYNLRDPFPKLKLKQGEPLINTVEGRLNDWHLWYGMLQKPGIDSDAKGKLEQLIRQHVSRPEIPDSPSRESQSQELPSLSTAVSVPGPA